MGTRNELYLPSHGICIRRLELYAFGPELDDALEFDLLSLEPVFLMLLPFNRIDSTTRYLVLKVLSN